VLDLDTPFGRRSIPLDRVAGIGISDSHDNEWTLFAVGVAADLVMLTLIIDRLSNEFQQ
jgi:hypothetical protein